MAYGSNNSAPEFYDVAIVGGALAGGAAAFLLLRQNPKLRVLIVEKSPEFSRRVGEATVEVSAYFLCRELGLTSYLNQNHLSKQGLRFWFAEDSETPFDECAEIGGKYLSRVPSFQVDRATLDQEILDRACALGAKLLRPAKVLGIELRHGGKQLARIESGGETFNMEARWVIDASGVAAILARANGWFHLNEEHPTTSVWARWRGVEDWDGHKLAEKFPEWAKAVYGFRGTATNHFNGDGWWAWCIPLAGGDVSIGIVFDQRLVELPPGETVGKRLKDFLARHPVARELTRGAEPIEGDIHLRKNLAYSCSQIVGDGFVLVGDAAGFMDPFYSPGMDWISFTVSKAVDLILKERAGETVSEKAAEANQELIKSYRRWFEAIYKDKYFYIGEYDLLRAAFFA